MCSVCVVCLDEDNHIHELSTELSHLQTIVQKQREEIRTLEHDVTKKNAELEVVSLLFLCFSMTFRLFHCILLPQDRFL